MRLLVFSSDVGLFKIIQHVLLSSDPDIAVDLTFALSPDGMLDLSKLPDLTSYDYALIDIDFFEWSIGWRESQALALSESLLKYIRRHAPILPAIALSNFSDSNPMLALGVGRVGYDLLIQKNLFQHIHFHPKSWLLTLATVRERRLTATSLLQHQTRTRDIFICHASEDKATIAGPLVSSLRQAAISYWYDEEQIQWGDSIVNRVSGGLRDARYVVVVLSRHSVGKAWPMREIESALSRELTNPSTRVLPLLACSEEECKALLEKLPLLADKLFVRWTGDATPVTTRLKQLLATYEV